MNTCKCGQEARLVTDRAENGQVVTFCTTCGNPPALRHATLQEWFTTPDRRAEIMDAEGRTIATTQYQDHPITAGDVCNARFICAAVNACREAGYSLWDLKHGAPKAHRDFLSAAEEAGVGFTSHGDGTITAHAPEPEALLLSLAECREALAEAQTKIQRLCQELGRSTDADTPKLFAALARLDAQR